MTSSSKPEVVAWIWDYRGRHMATTDYSQALELAEPPYPTEVEPLIRLSDYERLQADHERLQAECEELRQEVEALQGIQPEMPPMPPNGKGLPRYGVRWNGPTQPLSVPKDDGYWTPWHLAQAECEKLRSAIRRLCNIYLVDDYYMGQLREERLEAAVNRAINAAMQESSMPKKGDEAWGL